MLHVYVCGTPASNVHERHAEGGQGGWWHLRERARAALHTTEERARMVQEAGRLRGRVGIHCKACIVADACKLGVQHMASHLEDLRYLT